MFSLRPVWTSHCAARMCAAAPALAVRDRRPSVAVRLQTRSHRLLEFVENGFDLLVGRVVLRPTRSRPTCPATGCSTSVVAGDHHVRHGPHHARGVVGIDSAPMAITLCNEDLRRNGRPENTSFRLADARDTGFDPESFDVVVAADLFEHLYPDDSDTVAAEAFRVLRSGGRFVAWVPCRSHILEVFKNRNLILKADPGHVDYKSKVRMEDILATAGFRIEKSYYAESHLPVFHHRKERCCAGCRSCGAEARYWPSSPTITSLRLSVFGKEMREQPGMVLQGIPHGLNKTGRAL